jgi:hypothetical protein
LPRCDSPTIPTPRRPPRSQGKKPPDGFVPAQDPGPVTDHWSGWLLIGKDPEDRWHREAFAVIQEHFNGSAPPDGTYELVGPKVQGNPEEFKEHALVLHGLYATEDAPRDFNGLKAYLATHDIEGIVWHHPDGRMVKIKAKDFGLKRPKK